MIRKEIRAKILDIAMNLNRIGNWAADVLEWAEKLMTWGNILTHRTKLLS